MSSSEEKPRIKKNDIVRLSDGFHDGGAGSPRQYGVLSINEETQIASMCPVVGGMVVSAHVDNLVRIEPEPEIEEEEEEKPSDFLSKAQKLAIKCAYADLLGSLQAFEQMDSSSHDWDAHKLSLQDLEDQFPDLVGENKTYDTNC